MGRMAYAAAFGLTASGIPAGGCGTISVGPVLVPPNANRDACFEVQFFQDVLHVLLHGAGAAPKNLADLGVALAGRDPLHDLELALRQWPLLWGGGPFQIKFSGLVITTAIPGGHGGSPLIACLADLVHTF